MTATSTSTAFHRGAVLTAALVVATLNHALVLTLLLTTWTQAIAQEQPLPGFLPLAVAGSVVTLIAYAGLWTGHRWAFWLLVAMTVLAVTTQLLVGAPDAITLVQFALQGVLGVAVVRRWSDFD